MPAAVRVFGVRHHGPGSARSLLSALRDFAPDCVLIEGPPDADALIPLAADPAMEPPVALLVYQADEPRRAGFYPFATFSPEWVAMRFALAGGAAVRFMDLPQSVRLALSAAEDQRGEAPEGETPGEVPGDAPGGAPGGAPGDAPGAVPGDIPGKAPDAVLLRRDPLGELARAAGFEDGERWWDELVESRATRGESVFAAVAEAMAALREAMPDEGTEAVHEERREAWMRTAIRGAAREGHARVAVVCGAWHAPALALHDARGQAAKDAATLKGLPRVKTEAAWAPWSYDRLAAASGYRAGVISPEWYDLVWHAGEAEGDAAGAGTADGGTASGGAARGRAADGVAARWMARAAGLLRAEDLDASPASVIEAVRLADALAALRGRERPALPDLDEACAGALLFADPAPMALIRRKLVIGERLGRVPEGATQTPVQADFAVQTRRLRLPIQAAPRPLDLDLRGDTDLARSRLLHRLRLIEVPWGTPQRSRGGRGTFREEWVLDWKPEHAVSLVAASRLGATVEDAAAAVATRRAAEAGGVAQLSALVGTVLDAHLPAAADAVLRALADRAALATDVFDLMDALPPLAELARYGSVRQEGAGPVLGIVAGVVPRIAAGLVAGCQSLDDEAAAAAKARLDRVQQAVALLERPELQEEWTGALVRLADQGAVHGRVVGRATRLLLDLRRFGAEEAGGRLRLALSHAAQPGDAAAWIEGFLEGGGTVLLHDAALLGILDDWLTGLPGARFVEVLPLVRRTLATFAAGERRAIGERVRGAAESRGAAEGFDPARAARVAPVLRLLLGEGAGA